MAQTAQDIITAALKRIRYLAQGQTATSEEASDCLDYLNQMLHGWEIRHGIDLGHTDLALTDDILLPDSHLNGIKNCLAVEIADEFGKAVPPKTQADADDFIRMLRSEYLTLPETSADPALVIARSRFDINTG